MVLQNKKVTEQTTWSVISENIEKYQKTSLKKTIWQIVNTFIPYVALWVLIIYSLSISVWLAVPLIILSAGFLVRLFIIFHDCVHGSYFKSQKINKIVGIFFGILAFTPYTQWRNQHLRHHATVGNLDKRGAGDVWTMTIKEYNSSSKWARIKYRIYRNPLVMFGIGSLYVFLIRNRMITRAMPRNEKLNVWFTNGMLALIFLIMSLSVGFTVFVVVQLSILYIAAISGLWLFYLQHQFEDVTWFRNQDWNFRIVALKGSSYVKFPKLLQWFSGNIGFHHIHHMNARIPNYNLDRCYREIKVFNEVKPITFLISLKSLKLRLWDENLQKLVAFKDRQYLNIS
jgi:omega-6 fatty acid desaturase (delta-12 desaturase)